MGGEGLAARLEHAHKLPWVVDLMKNKSNFLVYYDLVIPGKYKSNVYKESLCSSGTQLSQESSIESTV